METVSAALLSAPSFTTRLKVSTPAAAGAVNVGF
jgi:hypothetical protein